MSLLRPDNGPLFPKRRQAVAAGIALWALGMICLADAYRGGQKPPFLIRMIMPPS